MKVFGVLLVLAGLALGIYVGVWLMFVGGIVQVVQAAVATPLDAWGLAVGLARFFLSGLAGWLSAVLLVLPGVVLAQEG